MIKAIVLDCGCFYQHKGDADGQAGVDVLFAHHACMTHARELSSATIEQTLQQTAREFPNGTVADTLRARGAAAEATRAPRDVFAGDNDRGITGLRLADGSIAPAKPMDAEERGKLAREAVAASHTLCEQLFTLGERRALTALIVTEHTTLLAERRTLVTVRDMRNDGSWEGRIKDIDTREEMLRGLLNKIKVKS